MGEPLAVGVCLPEPCTELDDWLRLKRLQHSDGLMPCDDGAVAANPATRFEDHHHTTVVSVIAATIALARHAAGARKRGSCRRSRLAASASSRTTTGSGARAAADHQTAPGRRTGPEAHVHRDHGRAGRVPGPIACWPTSRTPPGRTALTCGGAGTPAPSRTRPTRLATARNAVRTAVASRSSTHTTTKLGTQSSAASIASRGTGPWPRGTTSSRSATRRPSSSRPSTSG
ncbi:DUF6895 family protein [Streptomyces sp. NPDC047853]|uniref:DUF6895 family protein n=1 Tax=Streptomyces sp. NPDC047853 TaxID=3365489 RepID=UPI00371E2267